MLRWYRGWLCSRGPFDERFEALRERIESLGLGVRGEDKSVHAIATCAITGLPILESDEVWTHPTHGDALLILMPPDGYEADEAQQGVTETAHAERYLWKFRRVLTTAFTHNQVSMKYRGVMELVARKEASDAALGNMINYQGDVSNDTPQQIWANTDARHWGPLRTERRRVDPRLLKEREINAHYMEPAEYQQLVANIKTDGVPTSTPLVCEHPDGMLEIISGHHRTKASIDADMAEIDIIVILDPIPEERKRALQLSHNSINGKDNPALLAKLFSGLDLNAKKFSFLTEDDLGEFGDIKIAGIGAVAPKFEPVTLLFLPTDREILETALSLAQIESLRDSESKANGSSEKKPPAKKPDKRVHRRR